MYRNKHCDRGAFLTLVWAPAGRLRWKHTLALGRTKLSGRRWIELHLLFVSKTRKQDPRGPRMSTREEIDCVCAISNIEACLVSEPGMWESSPRDSGIDGGLGRLFSLDLAASSSTFLDCRASI